MADAPEWVRLSDQEVVLMARAGREAAYRELIRRYERPIFALLFRMVRDRELAEDLSQETFVKALNAIESYRPEFKFSSWIFKIANNAAIDHLRRRELDTLSLDGSPHAETPEAMQATALQIGARQESPLDAVEAKELGGAIEAGDRTAPARVSLVHPAAARRGPGRTRKSPKSWTSRSVRSRPTSTGRATSCGRRWHT